MGQLVEYKGKEYDFPEDTSKKQILTFLSNIDKGSPANLEEQEDSPRGDIVFNSLKEDEEYVQSLKNNWASDNEGKSFKGSVDDLIEEDFEHWNLLDANLVAGALSTGILLMSDLSEQERADTLTRFDRYDRTKATGTGSRSLYEQAKGVGVGVFTDPTTYSLVANLPKIAKIAAGRTVIRQLLSTAVKPAAAGALASSVSEVERQTREIAIGARSEINGDSIKEAALLGGIVGQATKLVPSVVKGSFNALTNPLQKTSDLVRKVLPASITEKAAVLGIVHRASEDITETGADLSVGGQRLSSNITQMFNTTNRFFEEQYSKINGIGTPPRVIEGALEQWKATGLKVPTSAIKTVERMNQGKVTPEEALRTLRRQMSQQEVAARQFKGDMIPDDAKMVSSLRNGLTNALVKSVKRSGGDTKTLDRAYSKWRTLQDSRFGKSLLRASEDNVESEKLIKKLIAGDFALSELNSFTKALKDIEKLSGSKDLTNRALKNVREGAGELLLAKDGAQLTKLLSTGRGFKTLQALYPSNTKTWEDLESLASLMSRSNVSGSNMITNITAATVGNMVGTKALGKIGGLTGALVGVKLVSDLTASKFFRNAMANSYLRKEGRLSKGTKVWLRNTKGMSTEQINDIQTAMFAMPMGYVAGETYPHVFDRNEESQ